LEKSINTLLSDV